MFLVLVLDETRGILPIWLEDRCTIRRRRRISPSCRLFSIIIIVLYRANDIDEFEKFQYPLIYQVSQVSTRTDNSKAI